MAGNIESLKTKITATYQESMAQDAALDLFDPSVEALLMPFLEPAVLPRPTQELGQKRFDEYFRSLFRDRKDVIEEVAAMRKDPAMLAHNPCGEPIFLWSIPRPCLRVKGERGTFNNTFTQLFAGDLLWLYFHEKMGIHRMIGVILDDFVTKGRFPIRPSSYEGLMIEAMVREVQLGLSTTVRGRDTAYCRVLGLRSDAGLKLDAQDAPMNTAFTVTFNRLIELALGYYNEKRLASAIQNTVSVGRPSVATVTTIRDTIGELRKSLDPFKYGRNHTHTLMGIVWTIAGLDLISRLRTQLGIPEPYDRADELVPAAYDLLVGASAEKINGNRYTAHRDCAVSGRNILLDVQGMDVEGANAPDTDEIAAWLDAVEGTFENYRMAYRVLTGTDLGTSKVSVTRAA